MIDWKLNLTQHFWSYWINSIHSLRLVWQIFTGGGAENWEPTWVKYINDFILQQNIHSSFFRALTTPLIYSNSPKHCYRHNLMPCPQLLLNVDVTTFIARVAFVCDNKTRMWQVWYYITPILHLVPWSHRTTYFPPIIISYFILAPARSTYWSI